MKFYILFEGQTFDEALELGDLSFKTFYGEAGLDALNEILARPNADELLDDMIIKDEKSKTYTIKEFLDVIESSYVFTQKRE